MLPIHNELHHIGTETDDSVSIYVSDMSAEDQSIIKEMLELFPTILYALKPTGRLRGWTNFIKLLADGTFPVDNLAFQLLMDVSKWYSSETVYGMRYSEEVKHFWTLGYKLFKEKFYGWTQEYRTNFYWRPTGRFTNCELENKLLCQM